MADLAKPQVLFIAIKSYDGISIAYMMNAVINEFNKNHSMMHAWGLPIENDNKHDEQVRVAVNRMKFDIISFGGGVRAHPEWAARIQTILDQSLNQATKVVSPNEPHAAIPLVLEAARQLNFDVAA